MKKDDLRFNFNLTGTIQRFTDDLYASLFSDQEYLELSVVKMKRRFTTILQNLGHKGSNIDLMWTSFHKELPEIKAHLELDAKAFLENDPAAKNIAEVILCYPGFFAIAVYRLSHALLQKGISIMPRIMSEYAHSKTGTDINPGAQIGRSFFIDHATGVVIGETTIIKDHVKLYQGVTLGALHVAKHLADTKRHPTIEDNVTLYANATILGGSTIIGANSIIGGNVWLTETVPSNSLVTNTPNINIKQNKLSHVNH